MKKALIIGISGLMWLSACAQAPISNPQRDAQLTGRGGYVQAGTFDSSTDYDRTAGVQASPGNAAPVLIASTGISDEQDFDAVSSRETIESDAQRLERQAAAYEVISPTALPQRDGNVGPNIVAYALSVSNERGQRVYERSGFMAASRFQRNCAKYNTPDAAQRDFLARGGPQRDPKGLDPDGDGFACGWDPTPFRALARAQQQQPQQ